MPDTYQPSQPTIAERRKRRSVAMHLQTIENNPLDAQDIAMFEMFDREGWDTERRLAHITALARKLAHS